MSFSIWIGFDAKDADAFAVARNSANRRLGIPVPVYSLVLSDLQATGYYKRPVEKVDGVLYDPISEAPMSTEFAISRFLVPQLAQNRFRADKRNGRRAGWALFVDADVLFRVNPNELFALVDNSYALMCVKHNYVPHDNFKMDGQPQTLYSRKNWSSVMLINCDHPSNEALWADDLVNTLPGRDLHRFCWLKDDEIGELGIEWNYLVGQYTKEDCESPKLIHYTSGVPTLKGYEDCEYAPEWRDELRLWAVNGR